jgi:CheY-like chemotaxis protein
MGVLRDRYLQLPSVSGYLPKDIRWELAVPADKNGLPPHEGDTSLLLPGHGELVLVVDDDDKLRAALGRMLKSLGFNVVTAANGQDALDVVHTLTTPIDAALVDVVMPKLGGPELVDQLAQRGTHPAVIYMTGYDDPARLSRVLETPSMTPLLHKPFTLHALVLVLRNLLDRRARR